MSSRWYLPEDRYFEGDAARRRVAGELYDSIARLPIVSPHGHVDARLLADPNASLGTPADLFIIPDHYVFRMLYSQGIALEALGVATPGGQPVERDHRQIWQTFAEHFYLFQGTPSGTWLAQELYEIFGIPGKLTGGNAQEVYEAVEAKLATPEFRPRALFQRFNIEVLCTTDGAADPLAAHQALRAEGWPGKVRPTFRPDGLTNLEAVGWRQGIERLSAASGIDVNSYAGFIEALENRRVYFKQMGATATDQGVRSAHAERLAPNEVQAIFARALGGRLAPGDADRFTAHMIMESARMSVEDGLVMQLHVGAVRGHNPMISASFGDGRGDDIPERSEFTHNLRPLLNAFGNDPHFSLILFTLDESTYARELAPLAGHYPAVKLGPPWWFHDSLNGMARYFDQVMETAGLYNTAGFNDDTRAFCSIPARHDVWRRASANWLAGLVTRGLVDEEDAHGMAREMAYGLAKRAYRLA